MNIVRIIARLNVGGPARHVAWLTAATREAGHDSVLVAGVVPPGEDDMTYFAAQQGVEPLTIPEMSREISPQDAVTIWKLYQLFRRLRPDIVHTHTAKAGTVGRVAGLLYRWLTPAALLGRPRPCRFVHTYHGHVFHSYYGPLKTRLFLGIEKILARIATDRIVVISPQQYREIHEQFGVGRADQFAIIPLGLDLGAVAGTAPADRERRRRAARGAWGAGEREVLIGIVGRLTEIKNHQLFLRAAALYKKGGSRRTISAVNDRRVRFVVIGDGHLRKNLEAEARALGLEDDVVFTGTRHDPENFYPALDVVALTSLNEGTPLTLIEALANARAVIATAVGGVGDLLGANGIAAAAAASAAAASNSGGGIPSMVCERGVLVRPGDPEAFCRALALLIDDEDLRRAMGERGRQFVERSYSKNRLVADILDLYDEILKTEAGHAPAPEFSPPPQQQQFGPARSKGD